MNYLEKDFLVQPSSSAQAMGSGDLEVLATPAVIAFGENTCKTMAKELLAVGQTTIGTQIQISHLKASKIGGSVKVKAHLNEQTNNLLTYGFDVFENEDCLARGTHQRAIVDVERFLSKLEE